MPKTTKTKKKVSKVKTKASKPKTKTARAPKMELTHLTVFLEGRKTKKINLIGMPRMVWPLSRFASYMQQNRHRV